MAIIKSGDLKTLREKYKNLKIVYCSGTFDMTHVGHILFFEDCKKYGDLLFVNVGRDDTIKKLKGEKRPILNQYVRIKTIDSLKPVDFCFVNSEDSDEEKHDILRFVMENLKPNVYVVNEDAFDIKYRIKIVEEFDTKMEILPRYCPKEFENISTSNIIEKIKNL